MKKLLLYTVLVLSICQAYAVAPANYAEALQAGADDVAAQNYADAREDYAEALKFATTDADKQPVHLMLGSIDIAEKKYADARTRFAKVLEAPHLLPETKFQAIQFVGLSYMAEAKYSEARGAFDQALAVKDVPNLRWSAQQQKGMAFLLEKKYAQARKEFEKLRDYKMRMPYIDIVVDLLLGKSYSSEANFEVAREQFAKVLGAKEEGAVLGDAKELKPTIKALIQRYKQQAQLGTAESYLKEKNLAKATEEYSKVLGMEHLSFQAKAEAEKQLKAIADLEAKPKN